MAISNAEFGRRTGYHFSMASRIMSGDRLPSTNGLVRIAKEFDLDLETLIEKHQEGAEVLGAYLRENCHTETGEFSTTDASSG